MGPVEIHTAEARFTVHPELGGWLTQYSREVTDRGWIDVLHADAAAVARYPKEMWAGNPILFPLIAYNHLPGADHHYAWGGQRFPLPQHGFARRLPWTVVATTAAGVTLELTDTDETRAVYPFRFVHRLTYWLEGGRLHAEHQVINRDSVPLPFGLGIHPYLRLPVSPGGRRDDCCIRIPRATRYHPVGRAEGFFTEPFPAQDLSVAGDFSGTMFLGELESPELRLIDPVGRLATVLNWADAPSFRKVALWSRTPQESFFCLEPWTGLPNAFTRAEPGELIQLAPGATWSARWWLDTLPLGQ
jgi:galactose mutarotase-like enzyme